MHSSSVFVVFCTHLKLDLSGDGTGTLWTATAHVVTAVIGAGVLALPWSVAQLGWVIGPAVLLAFAWVTYYTAILLCDCYRYPDKSTGRRNSNYMEAVSSILGTTHFLHFSFPFSSFSGISSNK